MKVVVLNGSPKGENSVSMQYVKYLEKKFPGHQFEYIHAAFRCGKMEKDPKYFNEVMDVINAGDLILWGFPLYFLMVHSQYKRFIEIIFEKNREDVFWGKYAVAISTSIHFFDHTALRYIEEISNDLGMNFVGSFPAKMRDLMEEEKRSALEEFFRRGERYAEKGLPLPAIRSASGSGNIGGAAASGFFYHPGDSSPVALSSGTKVTIVADMEEGKDNCRAMVDRMRGAFPNADIINLREIKMGHCLGCLKCGFDNVCAYEGKDDYIEMYNEKVIPADIIVFAGTMHDRYLSHRWQCYLERSFVKTHQPVLTGKQAVFLVSGPLGENHNAREVLTAYADNMGANLISIITDEGRDSAELDTMITAAARDLAEFAEKKIKMPRSFLGAAGMKLFRDEVFSELRFVFQQDHKYYRKHGIYDFPQKRILFRIIISALVLLTKIPPLRRKIRNRLTQGMTGGFRKIIDQA